MMYDNYIKYCKKGDHKFLRARMMSQNGAVELFHAVLFSSET